VRLRHHGQRGSQRDGAKRKVDEEDRLPGDVLDEQAAFSA
jgi:hypothetical protein